MKRNYIKPTVKELNVSEILIQNTSGVTSDNGIGYGGTDTGGTQNPEAKQYLPDEFRSVWED